MASNPKHPCLTKSVQMRTLYLHLTRPPSPMCWVSGPLARITSFRLLMLEGNLDYLTSHQLSVVSTAVAILTAVGTLEHFIHLNTIPQSLSTTPSTPNISHLHHLWFCLRLNKRALATAIVVRGSPLDRQVLAALMSHPSVVFIPRM